MKTEDTDRCAWPRCRMITALYYLGKPICAKHWGRWAEDRGELRRRLKIKEQEK